MRVPDGVTAELKGWPTTGGRLLALSDRQVAEQIRADRIDILVDLALHTAGNRMLVFARKPAPVQVTMLGLPATTGLSTIDYRLTDPYLDPPGVSDGDYTERSIRLPHCFWCYQPPEESPPVGRAACAAERVHHLRLPESVSPRSAGPALELWVKILQARAGLAAGACMRRRAVTCDACVAPFREGGIAAERVEFVGKCAAADVSSSVTRELDLCLDPFPYNGHTSTLDALWMGVPVITLAGRTAVGRGGVSILSNAGLPELIADTPERYATLAAELAGDRTRLAELRAGLRLRMQASPLLDAAQYAADVEAALRRMWTTWCKS